MPDEVVTTATAAREKRLKVSRKEGHPDRQRLGVVHGQGLRHELADHDRNGGRLRDPLRTGKAQGPDQRFKALDRRHASDGGRERADDRDSDLDGRDETVRIGIQSERCLRASPAKPGDS